jgi:hypothetical protein
MYMLILNFTYPLRCLRVPLGVRAPPVEYHWARRPEFDPRQKLVRFFLLANASRPVLGTTQPTCAMGIGGKEARA